MSKSIITQINKATGFIYDDIQNKIVKKDNSEVNIDEFLQIQYLLDLNKINYIFEQNFSIRIIL